MTIRCLVCAVSAIALAAAGGCGGPDLTSTLRTSSYDSGMSGGLSPYSSVGMGASARQARQAAVAGTYAMEEVSFELPDLQGNPFDTAENDIMVSITRPDQQTVRIPAFYDGGTTWRVRYTPVLQGRHSVGAVTRNGQQIQPSKIDPRDFQVSGSPNAGFVRRDARDRSKFAFDNGSAYYPIGHNVAWGDVKPIIEKAGKAGVNWARVWMCHWGGANLDWVMDKKLDSGSLDLGVAKTWDEIVQAAERSGVYLQVVLQHHGQYSTRVNPNWAENPWNKALGGFLATPGEFFSSPRAIAQTRAKYRYIVARWGYSTHIMAWELFNEVEWTDAVANKHTDEVVAWHNEMARFLRSHDPYKHLVTSSSSLSIEGLWQSMDYLQPHAYPSDALAVTTSMDRRKADKPYFYGEIGPAGLKDDGTFLHRALWSSIASLSGGAAQYWMWDQIDKNDWYGRFSPAVAFVRQSGMTARRGFAPAAVQVSTNARSALTLTPGGGWASAKQTEYTVSPSASPGSVGDMPEYLHGSAHRDMFGSATFRVVYPEAGSFAVQIAQVAKAGGGVSIKIDGATAVERTFPASAADKSESTVIEAAVPAGAHAITISNPGADWVRIARIVLTPYAPALGVVGKTSTDSAVLWIYNRGKEPESGRIVIAGLKAGSYDVKWIDTQTGKQIGHEPSATCTKEGLALSTPAIATDIAMYCARSSQKAATPAKAPARRKPKGAVPSEQAAPQSSDAPPARPDR